MMDKSHGSNITAWYQLPANEVWESLGTDQDGLSSVAAKTRLEEYGYNELKFKKQGAFVRFLLQFQSALVYVLLAASIITAILGMWIDTSIILIVVIANAIIGFIQEGRAEASMDALTSMMVPECTVLRDGERKGIQARELVPGDVVILEEGVSVPADLRLIYARNLSHDEAMLTGESLPVAKSIEPNQIPNASPGDQRCMAFSGTFVTRGLGRGVVVATADKTEIGKIASLIKEAKGDSSAPLVRKVADFTKVIVIVILVLATINLIVGTTLGGYDLVYAFLASVSLAVAAIPEGLSAIITIALASGARTMANKNVLVRRLPAVETLGSATVICSDKTGTLTKNEMTVVSVYCGKKDYTVTGVGYEPKGEYFVGNESIDPSQDKDLSETLKAGMLCNNAELVQNDDIHQILGDPTEGALTVSAVKAGLSADITHRLDEIPFESKEQYMATLSQEEHQVITYVKGSPEKILRMCRTQLINGNIEPLDPNDIIFNADKMAGSALRVIGLAYKQVPANKTSLAPADMEGLTFLGLQGMIDPPRKEAIDSIDKCKSAGIRVVMLTGDHARTAQAVASQLGISTDHGVLTGEDLSLLSDDELYEVVERVSVYARVAPEHKFRVATQLQRRGEIVAMTGDGVNDAPALKAADLGIAMGIKGTDVTKEASDMVLVDDNFASIVSAVKEGRHVFENIRKVILYTLPTNGGQALLVMGSVALAPFLVLFSVRLPLEPIHILWINLYDAVALALPLLWEPREDGLLDKSPRDPKEPIANRLFYRKVGLVSVAMAASAFATFLYFGNEAISNSVVDEIRLTQAQTAAFMTVMMVHIFYLLTARSLTKSAFRINPFSNKWIMIGIATTLALQFLIVYVFPNLGINIFRTEPIPAHWWIFIVLCALPVFFIVEIEKFLFNRFRKVS